jgi:hypothetical protein
LLLLGDLKEQSSTRRDERERERERDWGSGFSARVDSLALLLTSSLYQHFFF